MFTLVQQNLNVAHDPRPYFIPTDETESATTSKTTPVLPWPDHDNIPVSEFSTPFLATMAFPTLFPYGEGDPFGIYFNANKKTFIEKVRHLIMFSQKNKNTEEYVCRFARHARFIQWICNVYYRRRTLDQGDIYLRQCPGDANKSVEEIQQLLKDKKAEGLINNINRYMSNIPGTSSYWFNVSAQLDAIIECKGPPHFFFTLTYADRYVYFKIFVIVLDNLLLNNFSIFFSHCPYLREYLKLPSTATEYDVDMSIKNNPHHVNQFFMHKVETFIKCIVVDKWKSDAEHCGWWWYRYEWQNRGTIHVHGFARIGNGPDTYKLADLAIKSQRLLDLNKTVYTEEEQKAIELGLNASIELCNFHDDYICTDIPIPYDEWTDPRMKHPPKKYPASVKEHDVPNSYKEQDNIDLAILLQRHPCNKKCADNYGKCKLKYPRQLHVKTTFEINK